MMLTHILFAWVWVYAVFFGRFFVDKCFLP